MSKNNCEVALLFRHYSGKVYSIEYLFDRVLEDLRPTLAVRKIILPYATQGLKNILGNLLFVSRHQFRVTHVTGDCYYTLMAAFNSRRVVTYHDLSFLERTKGLRRWLLKTFWVRLPLFTAHQVVSVSKSTQLALHQASGMPLERIKVIPNFIDDIFQPVQRVFNIDTPRILQVGTDFNKNLDRVIEAVANFSCTLVIIGRLRPQQLTQLQSRNINYENYFGLSIENLYGQYVKADLLCFTSTIEGFGMPILEAQACGLPVITSNCSSMPEVSGGGAVLVNPTKVSSIRKGILLLTKDAAQRKAVVEAGYHNAKNYSRRAVAEAYFKIYKEQLAH